MKFDLLPFWAWVYRVTGWYSPWARAEEYAFIKKMIPHLERARHHVGGESIEEAMRIEIGMWQSRHGFYR